MNDFIFEIEPKVIEALRKGGRPGVLAFCSGLIRAIVKESGLSPEERCQYVGVVSDLMLKYALT